MSFGKILVFVGLGIALLGAVWMGLARLGIHLGRLPGDLHIEGERGSFHFPIVTSLVISVVATLVLNFLLRK